VGDRTRPLLLIHVPCRSRSFVPPFMSHTLHGCSFTFLTPIPCLCLCLANLQLLCSAAVYRFWVSHSTQLQLYATMSCTLGQL